MGNDNRFLVIKPSSLGDVLHVFPALELLRRACPESELDFLIAPAFAPLLDFCPFPVRRRILFERRKLGSWRGFSGEFVRLTRELRRDRYRAVLDFQGLFRSGFFAFLARSAAVYGFAAPRERAARWFYSRRVAADPTDHAVRRNVALVNAVTGNSAAAVPELVLPPHPEFDAFAAGLPEKLLVLVPGARWLSKRFPPELFARVGAAVLRERPDYRLALAGSAGDAPAGDALISALPPGLPVLNLIGRTSLPQLAGLLRRAGAVLTNDSGPMHLAALAGTRVFAFFGSTDPALTGPWGAEHRVYCRSDLPCLRCLKRRCPRRADCFAVDGAAVAADIVAALNRRSVQLTPGGRMP